MARKMINSGIEWIGEIPETWNIYPALYGFSEIRKKNTDGQITKALKFYNGTIIPKTNFDADSDDYVAETITNYTIVGPDTIMINGLNLNYDLKSLRVGRVRETGVITSAYLALCPNQDRILSTYATYLFKGYEAKMAFHNMGAGIRKTLGFKEFRRQPVLFPPLEEQKKIVVFLDSKCSHIDEIIKQTRDSIEEYKKLKQSIITEAVTKGVHPECPLKNSGVEWVDKIPDGWEVARLKNLFEFGKGLPITKDNLLETGVPVISYGQIHSKITTGVELQPHLFRYVSEEYLMTNPQSLVHKGDFIFADTSEDLDGCGNAVYVDSEMVLFAGYHTIVLFNRGNTINKYLAYQFRTDGWRSQIRSKVSGVKLFSISRKILSDTICVIPPQNEASRIVEFLDKKCADIDQVISTKEQLIKEMEAYKKSLIFEYVTGKKEVPIG